MNVTLFAAEQGVSFPGLGINDLDIDRVAFTIGSFPVYWYGICIILAFGACIALAMLQSKRFGFKSDDIIDISLVVIPSAIVGARLYYVASAWSEFAENPMSIFDIRSGGLAVLGGVLLSLAAVLVLARFRKWNAGDLFNAYIVYIPLGQAIGRWGNFFNQEAFGTNTTLPWGMISPETAAYLARNNPELDPTLPVHPTFFYEFLACLLIFFILLLIREKSKLPYVCAASYFILYGIARFFIEGLRTDSLYIGNTGLRTSQVFCALMIVAGFAIIAFFRYRKNKLELATATAGSTQSFTAGSPEDAAEPVDSIDVLTEKVEERDPSQEDQVPEADADSEPEKEDDTEAGSK